MRVISGTLKGRKLASFRGQRIRPTSDRVREAIFDILAIEWGGKEVLDLFAGTGGLGIEALSRGAHRVVFVENHPPALMVLKKNLKTLNLGERSDVLQLKVEAGIRSVKKKGWTFDVIFLDPPYAGDLADSTLRLIAKGRILKAEGLVVIEHACKEPHFKQHRTMKMVDERRYGRTRVSFFVSSSV